MSSGGLTTYAKSTKLYKKFRTRQILGNFMGGYLLISINAKSYLNIHAYLTSFDSFTMKTLTSLDINVGEKAMEQKPPKLYPKMTFTHTAITMKASYCCTTKYAMLLCFELLLTKEVKLADFQIYSCFGFVMHKGREQKVMKVLATYLRIYVCRTFLRISLKFSINFDDSKRVHLPS
ncbi:CLUMA_CG007287, isoform A [Clunio marinus]|uniref:CLUMA_CG007287, isoform A n=1 Tax=Clunio marinus TaxID=568069 RepID=A0A1J1I078_9DIPT|nr:CLUMA_CG007287, isoform A [Clunio marinus]